jgi:hypothetical protein
MDPPPLAKLTRQTQASNIIHTPRLHYILARALKPGTSFLLCKTHSVVLLCQKSVKSLRIDTLRSPYTSPLSWPSSGHLPASLVLSLSKHDNQGYSPSGRPGGRSGVFTGRFACGFMGGFTSPFTGGFTGGFLITDISQLECVPSGLQRRVPLHAS